MSIYDLPWYLLIGEPQSGKSTTLKNSGLEFPIGSDSLSGAGGTHNRNGPGAGSPYRRMSP